MEQGGERRGEMRKQGVYMTRLVIEGRGAGRATGELARLE